jgi:hypothetical protein
MLTLPNHTRFVEETKVRDDNSRSARLRHTATGALAAFAAAGAIAGTVALADSPPAAKAPGQATIPSCPGKTGATQPSAGPQPFLNAVRRLVDNGTITRAQGQAVDREIVTGRVDTGTLAPEGFAGTQVQAVEQSLADAKRSLAPTVAGAAK